MVTAFIVSTVPGKYIIVCLVFVILESFVGIGSDHNRNSLREVSFYLCHVVDVFYPEPVFDGVGGSLEFEIGRRFYTPFEIISEITQRNVPAGCVKPSADLKSYASTYTIKNWFRVEDINNMTEVKTYLSQGIPIVIAAYTDKT